MSILNIKNEVALLAAIFPLLVVYFFKPSVITFFTATKSEKLLLSKELRVLHKLSLYLFFFIIFPITMTFDLHENGFISGLFPKIYNSIVFGIIFLFSIGFVLLIKSCDIYKWQERKGFFIKKSNRLLIIPLLIIIAYLSIYFGLLVSEIIRTGSFQAESLSTLVIYTVLYIFVVHQFLYYISSTVMQENIKCTIKLDNGDLIKDAYFLHPTYGRKIVIGNAQNSVDSKQTIVIPLTRIVLIEFISDNYKFWGKEEKVSQENKIIFPNEK